MLAKDIMHKKVATVRPETSLRELLRLFDERGITGAPVVGPEGHLIGVVSRTDLLRAETRTASADVAAYHHADDEKAPPPPPVVVPEGRVESIMTPWVISFEEDTPVEELARQMLAKRIHRVIITRDGRLCGIVTSMDLLRGLLALLAKR